ncbi:MULTISPECIES: RHS repeat-associated core domain-containing protein [unclassified Streptomyces]|uniref:RHS repeat-associated core domain-containing protein n=1 Tax=unclassified Streptomyces TaxID=2593676 RepID=UPI00278C6B10|nr:MULTISPECIES: RHS repeat-associated core domain-containing protein [unclassified Streptomyces]
MCSGCEDHAFGAPRSEDAETLPGARGFVGGTTDPTGLTHLGAREYDPTTGRFLSVDPVLDLNDPLQMNAYAYANSRPVTASDPDGRMFYDDFTGLGFGNTTAQKHAYQKWGYRDSHGRTTKKYKRKLAYDNKRYAAYRRTSYYKKTMRNAWRAEARAAAERKAQAAK